MISKGVAVVLVLTSLLSGIEAQCGRINQQIIDNRWHVRYLDVGGSLLSENMAFSTTEISFYDGTGVSPKETYMCEGDAEASPFLYLYVSSENANGETERFCFAIGDTNDEDDIAFLFRRVQLTSTDLATITSANSCQDLFTPGAGRSRYDDFEILVRTDPGSATPFEFALTNGQCTSNLPEAYNRGVEDTDEDILLSLLYRLEYTEDGTTTLCQGNPGSQLIREGNTIEVRSCTNVPAGYYQPVSNTYTCLTNSLHASFGLSTTADIQIVAIPDGSTYHFACMRHTQVNGEACVQYSLDLTNREEPKCRIVYDQNDVSGSMIDADTAFRVVGDTQKGHMSFKACSTDCDDIRCRSGSNCTQFLGSFRCGDYNADTVQYICPEGFEGHLCEINVNDCDPNPCLNNGVCTDQINGFTCTCPDGWKGIFCEIETCVIPAHWRNKNYFYKYDSVVSTQDIALNVFEDAVTILIDSVTYDCEKDTIANGRWTASGLNEATADTRRCFQGIEHTQVTPDNDGDTFILYRTMPDEPNTLDPIPPGNCNFGITDPFQILIPPNPNYVSEAPFPEGIYYQVYWQQGAAGHCDGDQASRGRIDGNTIDLHSVCDSETALEASITNPIAHIMSVVYYWPAVDFGDTNSDSNGNVVLLAVTFMGDDAPTYYCARWTFDGGLTIHISLNYASGLFPECLVNDNSMETENSHLYIRLTSNACERLTPCNNGQCTNSANQEYRCSCPDGFSGDNCEINDDECGSSPCHAEGALRCEDGDNEWTCICNAGWDHDPNGQPTCSLRNFCHNINCNNGECQDTGTGYRCNCEAGWTGDVCDVDIDECASDPCQNGGRCKETVGDNNDFMIDYFECVCLEGFTGIVCQNERDNCDSMPCRNNGICYNYPQHVTIGYYCDCTETNFIWQNCEHPNECKTMPCHERNTLACEDRLDERICFCKEGYIGGEDADGRPLGDCSQVDQSNPCHSSPCRNEAICLQDSNDEDLFECRCRGPWAGPLCDQAIVTCASNPCPGGIACIPYDDNVNSTSLFRYECDCPDHLTGRNCENDDDDFGAVEQGLVGLLVALLIGCAAIGVWAVCANKCGPCGPKGGCCP